MNTPKEIAEFYADKDDEYILRLARHPKGLRKDVIPVLIAELKRRNLDDHALIRWITDENNEFADTELENVKYRISISLCPKCKKNNDITGFINRYIEFGEIKEETILVCKSCGIKQKKKRLLTTLTLGLSGLFGVFIFEGHRTFGAFLVPFYMIYQVINLLFHKNENDTVYKDFIEANTGYLRRSLSDDGILRLIKLYNRDEEQVKETGKNPKDNIQSSKEWWASQRRKYNKGLVIAGISAFVLYAVLGSVLIAPYDADFEITLFTTVFQALGYLFMMAVANLLYNLGYTVERIFSKTEDIKFRKRLFNLGYWFSFGLPFLLPLMTIVHSILLN